MNIDNEQLQPLTETECAEIDGGFSWDLAALAGLSFLGISLVGIEGEIKLTITP
jgi:hypothetical protein